MQTHKTQPTTFRTVTIPRVPPKAPAPGDKLELTRFDWLCATAQLPGKAAALGLMLTWLVSQQRTTCVSPTRRLMRRFGVSRDACGDGLRRLEDAKLVHVWRLPGRSPMVILLEPGTEDRLRFT